MSLFKTIGDELADFVDWVREYLEDDLVRRSIAEDLGLQPGESVPKVNLPQEQLDGIARYRSQANPDKEALVVLLNDLRAIYEAVRSFITACGVSNVTLANELLYRLFDLAALNYVRLKSPKGYFIVQALAALAEDTAELDAATSGPDDGLVVSAADREVREATFERFFSVLATGVGFALSPLYYIFKTLGAEDEAAARRVSEHLFPHIAAALFLSNITHEVIHGWDTLEEPLQLRAGVGDLAGLVLKLKDNGSAMAEYLRKRRTGSGQGEVIQGLINSYSAGLPSDALRQMVLDELDAVLREADLFDKLDELLKVKGSDGGLLYDRIPISERTRVLAAAHPQGDELVRLNLSLLEAAFPEEISKSSHPLADTISERALTIAFPFADTPTSGSEVGASVTITLSIIPATHAQASGLLISIGGTQEMEIDLSSKWKFLLSASAEPAFSIFLDTHIHTITGHGPVDAPLNVAIVSIPDENNVTFSIPDGEGTRLEIGQLAFSFGFNGTSGEIKAQAKRCALVIETKDQDGFLAKVLPGGGLRVPFDFGVGFSTEKRFFTEGGVQWPTTGGTGQPAPSTSSQPRSSGAPPGSIARVADSGAGGLEDAPKLSGTNHPELGVQQLIQIGKTLLGVTLNHLLLGLAPSANAEAKASTEVSASFAIKLGPVTAAVDRIGFEFGLAFPRSGGNLGFADLALGFKAPSGVGIKVDSPFVSGGGFLYLDTEKGQYAGFIQLTIQDLVTVTAIGVITTRLPGGGKGFSFVVMITAENFRPIPLGLGFTLTGIGGLLAINRTVNEEFLREGIKNKTLDSILFPKDPIRNAPQIFTTLNTAFPQREGSYLFGPVLQISWGTPTLLTMDLGLVLELGNRNRLVILGRVSAIMPSEKHDLLRLQMNALGVVDFDQSSISLDATLYDSRLAGKFPITGSMALRLRWGSAPLFALSIGGFHPAFKPPAGFPVLERLAISFSNTDSFRLRAEVYFALTSNTLQFGARADLYASSGSFNITGTIGFDVLIQFDPFSFIADFYVSLQLKYGSHNLFKVSLEGELAGPRPLHVKGKASFEIFWCDYSVSFDKTLVSGEAPPRPEPVVVMAKLKEALNDRRNWSGQITPGVRRMAALRESEVEGEIVLHPLGTLSVKQKVVPLELEIARFGNAVPADARVFTIDDLAINGKSVSFDRVADFFAPAQFLELTDDEKLKAPSFEGMTAGVSAASSGTLFTENDNDILESPEIVYETRIIDRAQGTRRDAPRFTISAAVLNQHLVLGAASRSDLRRTGAARYRSGGAKNRVVGKGWAVASALDGASAPGLPDGTVGSYAASFQALKKLKEQRPAEAKELMLVRVPTTQRATEVSSHG